MSGSVDPEAADGGAAEAVDWDGLPDSVRARLVEFAAGALGAMPKAEVPARLRPIARFTPAKRARVAAGPLLGELRTDAAFRATVVAWARENHPDALEAAGGDPAARAAAAVLRGDPDAAAQVRAVADQSTEADLRAERDAAVARARRLAGEVERLRADVADQRQGIEDAKREREEELRRLRARLRERGTELQQLREELRAATEAAVGATSAGADDRTALLAYVAKERARADAERTRADRATAQAQGARQAAREARRADEVRIALLLDAVEGAAAGLRTELGVQSAAGMRPAETVTGATSGSPPAAVTTAADLDRLLAVPSVHLLVDGYNVTKTGYPDLTLAEQRERLVRQLGAIAARTAAEVTVVFDGADVVAVPTVSARGVRVLFSERGVSADEVLKALVAAEPAGRPLAVVTSDRAIVAAVRADGAYPVPSRVLLDLV